MKAITFVPDDFVVKDFWEMEEFNLKKLAVEDTEIDYQAVMSSIDIIKKTRGGKSWPYPELTLEQDRIDLAWHQTEFDLKCSFAYTITNKEGTKSLGCIYIYPPTKPWLEYPEGTDAIVNFWVTQEEYDKGLYPKVYHFLKVWLQKEWPFKQIHFSNREIPE